MVVNNLLTLLLIPMSAVFGVCPRPLPVPARFLAALDSLFDMYVLRWSSMSCW